MESAKITLKPGPRQHRAHDQISQRVTHKTEKDNTVILLLSDYKVILLLNSVTVTHTKAVCVFRSEFKNMSLSKQSTRLN